MVWSVTVPDLQAWTHTILDCQIALLATNISFSFSRTTVFLAGPHAVCPFGMADWLNRLWVFIIYTAFLIKKKKRKNKKIKIKSSVASADWLCWHTHRQERCMAYQKQITASRRSNTERRIAKPVVLLHHSHRIVDSSRQSSPGISPKDCFKYGKFWGVDNFSYKLISRQIDNSVLCVSVKRNVHQDIWHQRVV